MLNDAWAGVTWPCTKSTQTPLVFFYSPPNKQSRARPSLVQMRLCCARGHCFSPLCSNAQVHPTFSVAPF